jgi:hypothetical protein
MGPTTDAPIVVVSMSAERTAPDFEKVAVGGGDQLVETVGGLTLGKPERDWVFRIDRCQCRGDLVAGDTPRLPPPACGP